MVAGLKQERPNPKETEGKQALFVVNLEPHRMRGAVSEECCSISGTPTAPLPHPPSRSGPYVSFR